MASRHPRRVGAALATVAGPLAVEASPQRLQREREVAGGLKTFLGLFFQAVTDDPIERGRHPPHRRA